MTRKKQSILLKLRCPWSFGSEIIICLGILLCLLVYLRIYLEFKAFSTLPVSRTPRILSSEHFEGNPKIAFLFLARRDLPLDFVWGAFFKNGFAANFSIYIHSEPGFVFNEITTRSIFFYGRQLNNSIQVIWGEPSMMEAERLLLQAALHDPANQRFVLLSDSCVPLYNFSYIYSYIMSSPKSFVESFIDTNGDRYNPVMSPVISKEKWRKGSQWITLVRRHAEIIADDDTVFPVFKKSCRRWPPRQMMKIFNLLRQFKKQNLLRIFQTYPNCICDEHYMQTLLAMKGLEYEIERRTLTYALWNQASTKSEAWHPVTFEYADAAPQMIEEIKAINHIHQKSMNRSEWCGVNNKFTTCFLFARKFNRGAAVRLLTEGFLGLYDPTALSNTPSPWLPIKGQRRGS